MSAFVQIITKWKENDNTFVFDISKFKNYYKSVTKIEIVNLLICEDETHAHFEHPKDTGTYPTDEDYQNKIRVSVPRPRTVEHRRRTIYFVPNLNLETEPLAEDLTEHVRVRRQIEPKRFKRELIEPNAIESTIKFEKSQISTRFTVKPDEFVDRIVPKINTSHFAKTSRNNFNSLLFGVFSIKKTSEIETDTPSFQITLPARTALVAKCPEFFNALGFENQINYLVQGMHGFKNTTNTPITFDGKQIPNSNMNALYIISQTTRGVKPENSVKIPKYIDFIYITFNKEQKNKLFFNIPTNCQNASLQETYAFVVSLFDTIMKTDTFILDTKILSTVVQLDNRANNIVLSLVPSSSKNFELSLVIGTDLQDYYKFQPNFTWNTSIRSIISGPLPRSVICKKIVQDQPSTSTSGIIKPLIDVITTSETEEFTEAVVVSDTEEEEETFSSPVGIMPVQRTPPPKPVYSNVPTPSIAIPVRVKTPSPPISPISNPLPPIKVMHSPKINPTVTVEARVRTPTPPRVRTPTPPIAVQPPIVRTPTPPPLPPVEVQPPRIRKPTPPPLPPVEVLLPRIRTPTPPIVVQPPIVRIPTPPPLPPIALQPPIVIQPPVIVQPPADNPVILIEDVDLPILIDEPILEEEPLVEEEILFEEIEIDNPVPPRPDTFIQFNPHYNPLLFPVVNEERYPTESVLIVQEGQNSDYIPSYGICTIAAFCKANKLSKSQTFKIDWKSNNLLSFQMVDRHLRLFTPKSDQYVSFFLKIDL